MSWFLEQNEWTTWIFALSVFVDFWAARRVDKHVHNPRLYLVLVALIVFGLIINGVYFIDSTLYNISPIGAMIIVVLMCKVLVDIHEENELKAKEIEEQAKRIQKETEIKNKEIIELIIKTNSKGKKAPCKNHYNLIFSGDLSKACPDCPLLE